MSEKITVKSLELLAQDFRQKNGLSSTELVALLDPNNSILIDEHFVSSYLNSGGEIKNDRDGNKEM